MEKIKYGTHSPVSTMVLYCALIFSMICHPLMAQDKIYKTDNSIIEVKVLEISTTEIKYKKFSNQNGPTYTISKTEVQMIVYENGEKEVFKTGNKQADLPSADYAKDDSVQCIEDLWGVRFENTQENGGGVRIVKLEGNSIFRPRPTLRSQSSLDKLSIYYVNNGKLVRVKTTSELASVLFESYNQGISKINLVSWRKAQLSSFTNDPLAIDITGLSKCQGMDTANKKLGIDESKKAGGTVAGIYRKGQNWAVQGFCSGLVFGVAGVGLIGAIAVLPPPKKALPKAAPNVDANAWSAGYKAKVRKKRLISGIIGSLIGSVLVIGVYSSRN